MLISLRKTWCAVYPVKKPFILVKFASNAYPNTVSATGIQLKKLEHTEVEGFYFRRIFFGKQMPADDSSWDL